MLVTYYIQLALCGFIMLSTVNFDNHLCSGRIKIHDIPSDWALAIELDAFDLSASQP